ncbi:MAG: hypothetical protein J6K76_03585 [Spirochaetaceae bacterium]|nr:hypothetical protein [Spirochaetaceae bacterium]
MKLFIGVSIVYMLFNFGCRIEKNLVKEDKIYNNTVEVIETYMVSDMKLSKERPSPDFLSPEEAMIRAAQALSTEGWLDSDNPIYKEHPRLLKAKVAEPVFVYNANFLAQGLIHGAYRIYAVDENDVDIAHVLIIGEQNIPEGEDSILMRGLSVNETYPRHFITKEEAVAAFQEAFPGCVIEEPIAVRMWNMEGVMHSNVYISWYTDVFDAGAGRGASSSATGYLMNAVMVVDPNAGVSSNPRAALSRSTVSGGWGTRIARIDEPLHLHEKLAAAKARAAAGEPEPAIGPTPPVKITPVEF